MHHRPFTLAAIVVTAGALVAACGTGDDSAEVTEPTAATTTDAPDPASTRPGTTAPGTSDPAPTTTHGETATTAPATTAATTTNPATTAPATTAPPSTVPASTTPATSAPPTTAPVGPSGNDVLAAWPDPRPAPQFADLPYLLPAGPIPGVVQGIRLEDAGSPVENAATSFQEIWRADGSPIRLDITTLLDEQPGALESLDPRPVEVDGWDEARVLSFNGETTALQLISDAGYVSIDSTGIAEDDLVEIGRSLRPADDVGWTITTPPFGLERLYGDWSWSTIGVAFRDLDWYDADRQLEAELTTTSNQQSFGIGDVPDVVYRLVDIGDARAVVIEWDRYEGAPTFVVWSPEPGVVVSFSSVLPADDTVDIARSLVEVDEATWNSVSTVDQGRDGCHSFVC